MQKLGYDPRNEGWKYIRLPQSIYLTAPTGERYYFGYSDPRFKYFEEEKSSFREIVTYGFLGFGEFNKTPDGLWSNNKFSLPPAILDLLLDATTEIREEQIKVWQNLFYRDPELVRQVGQLKRIFPYTQDGMYLYGENIEREFRERLLSLQGIVFITRPADTKINFEVQLKEHGLPDTKVFKKLLLGLVTRDLQYRDQPFNWAALTFQLYGLDNTQTLMQDLPDFFFTSVTHFQIKTEQFAQLLRFLHGVSFVRFRKLIEDDKSVFTNSLFGQNTGSNMRWLEDNFSLDSKDKAKPYFWEFVDQHKISTGDAIEMVGMNRDIKTLLEPIQTDIPVLYRDKVLEFRAPHHGLELYGWGKKLHNCLDQKYGAITRRTKRDFMFGIFESGKLIGAVQLSDTFRVRELRVGPNGKFDAEKEKTFRELVHKRLLKFNPSVRMRRALHNELEDLLTAPCIRPMLNVSPPGSVEIDKAPERLSQANEIILEYIKDLIGARVINAQQAQPLVRMAPQIIKRMVQQLGSRVPDNLRELALRSKRPRVPGGILPVPRSQPSPG